jgi:hypothetical protein
MSSRKKSSAAISPEHTSGAGSNEFLQPSTGKSAVRSSTRVLANRARTDGALAAALEITPINLSDAAGDPIDASPPPAVSKSDVTYTPVSSRSFTSSALSAAVAPMRVSPEARALLSVLNQTRQSSPAATLVPSSAQAFAQAMNSRYKASAIQPVLPAEPASNVNTHQPALQPELPLHATPAAQLQHSIAAAVAATQPPVDELQDAQNVVGQSAHWAAMERQLRAQASLTPAEQVQLSLLGDLQQLQQQHARQVELAQRERAVHLVELQQALGKSRATPILIPSQSPSHMVPATHKVNAQGAPMPALHTPPHMVPVSHTVTAQDAPTLAPPQSTTLQQSRLQPARLKGIQAPQPKAVSWLTAAQDVSKATAKIKLEKQKEEQQQYDAQRRIHADDAQDQAIIKAAKQRIDQRQALLTLLTTPGQSDAAAARHLALPTAGRPSALKRTTRQDELRFAALTGDKELLRHGSDKIFDEIPSDDEAEAILAELSASQAVQHLFSKAKAPPKSLRDKNGYIPNDFVAGDNEEEQVPSSQSVSQGTDQSSGETDGDPSSDYIPSSASASPPRRSASSQRSFSSAEWREYQELLKQKRSSPGDHQPRYNVSIAEPPEHGDWRDVQHLVTVFKDKHVKYTKRCGQGDCLSVWECYTETAQECIVRQLHENNADTPRDAAYLASLSDAELYTLLQNELGISYDMETEQALQAITFVGSILDKPSWVVFRTAWSNVLKRVNEAGRVQPKRMADIFRERIPDEFMQSWLKARKHYTWEEAYDAAVHALKDPNWHTCYSKHIISKVNKPDHSKKPALPAAGQHQGQHQQAKPQTDKPALPPSAASTPAPAQSQSKIEFPLSKNKNVNPNFKSDLNENPNKTVCERCGAIHKWLAALCTTDRHQEKGKKVSALSPEEFSRRLKARWDAGYWFNKELDAFTSPTVASSAAAAASATVRFKEGNANNGK